VTKRLAVATIGGVLLLASGCARTDQNALIIVGTDSVVTVAPLAIPGFGTEPGGSATANALELVDFDPAALDAFGRSSLIFSGQRFPNGYPYWRSSGYWYVSSTSSSSTGRIGYSGYDQRLPALTWPSTAGTECNGVTTDCFDYNVQYFAIADAFGSAGAEWWDIYGWFCCLAANQRVVLVLERNQLTVNGELDAAQVLLGQAVDQPDQLSWLGGSEAGDFTRPTDLFNTGAPYPNVINANPYIVGYALADATGYVYLDAVVSSNDATGAQVWMRTPTPNQATSPFSPNVSVRWDFPNYNYMTFYESNPDGSPDYSSPVARYQWGVDLSALGGPINNAYAPFPRAALSANELALGTGAISRPDSVTFSLNYIKELAGTAVYQVWAIDGTGAYTSLDFMYTPPGGTASLATSFKGGVGTHTIMLEYPDDATHIVYSIEGAPTPGPSPSTAQMLWASGLQPAGDSKSTSLDVMFGTFQESRTWAISGLGGGGLLGTQVRYLYDQLPRPPVGYKFVGWLASGDTLFTRLADATYTTPPQDGYQELTNADVDQSISSLVQETMILESMTRICLTSGDTNCVDINDYDTFFLALEPKAGMMTDPAATRVMQGVTPAR
jgi:hypothetical protein